MTDTVILVFRRLFDILHDTWFFMCHSNKISLPEFIIYKSLRISREKLYQQFKIKVFIIVFVGTYIEIKQPSLVINRLSPDHHNHTFVIFDDSSKIEIHKSQLNLF